MSKVREWAEEMRRMCHNEKDGLAALLSTLGSVDSIARTQEEARATLAATERSAETALAGVDVDHRAFGFVKDELTKLTLAMDKAFEVRLKEIYGRKLTELSDEIIKAAASVLDQPGWSQTQTESSQFEWGKTPLSELGECLSDAHQVTIFTTNQIAISLRSSSPSRKLTSAAHLRAVPCQYAQQTFRAQICQQKQACESTWKRSTNAWLDARLWQMVSLQLPSDALEK